MQNHDNSLCLCAVRLGQINGWSPGPAKWFSLIGHLKMWRRQHRDQPS